MIHRLIELSLRNRGPVIAIYLGLAAWGYWALLRTPIDAIPDLEPAARADRDASHLFLARERRLKKPTPMKEARKMSDRPRRKLVTMILVVIAAVLVLGVFSIWMMPSMMGGMMGGGMMGSMNEYMGLYTFGPLLLAAVLVALAAVLLRRSGARNGEKR